MQRQTTVAVYYYGKLVLLLDFALQDSLLPLSTGILTAVQRQTAVTAYLNSKQLLLFVFELRDSLLPSSTGIMTAVQRKTAVTAYLKSKQLLLFVFELHDSLLPSSTGILTTVQRQTEVTAYFSSNTLLLFTIYMNLYRGSQQTGAFTPSCFNVGSPSSTLAQHWNSIGWMSRVTSNDVVGWVIWSDYESTPQRELSTTCVIFPLQQNQQRTGGSKGVTLPLGVGVNGGSSTPSLHPSTRSHN